MDDELILRCREISDVSRAVAELVLRDLESVAQRSKIYVFKHRFKALSGIYSKVLRRRREGATEREVGAALLSSTDPKLQIQKQALLERLKRLDEYSPERVTDGFACRYVTLFQEQIPELIKFLFDALHNYNTRNTTLVNLDELTVYTSRRRDDKLSIADSVIQAYKSTEFSESPSGKAADVKPDKTKKNAYTSVHMIFSIKLIMEHVGKEPDIESGTFEVQVRDIFEEGWGEIDHYVSYSDKDKDKDKVDDGFAQTDIEIERRDRLETDLRILKEAVHGCGALARSVHGSFRKVEAPESANLARRSATPREIDRDAILAALRGRAPTGAAEHVREAYTLLSYAEAAKTRDVSILNYRKAADKFEKALAKLGAHSDRQLVKRGIRPLSYFLSMEFANSLLFGEVHDRLGDARAVFEDMTGRFSNDPVARLRLAHCLFSIAPTKPSFFAARDLLEKAATLITKDALTKDQPWMAIAIQIHLSFVFWRLSELQMVDGEGSEARDSLSQAAESALKGYNLWRERPEFGDDATYQQYSQKALSNLLYLAAEIILSCTPSELFNEESLRRWVAEFLELNKETYWHSYKADDNLMRAYVALRETAAAQTLAARIFAQLKREAEGRAGRELNLGEIGDFLHGDEREPFKSAVRVLTGS